MLGYSASGEDLPLGDGVVKEWGVVFVGKVTEEGLLNNRLQDQKTKQATP